MIFEYNENACRVVKAYFEFELAKAQEQIRRLERERDACLDIMSKMDKEIAQAPFKYIEAHSQVKIREMEYFLDGAKKK